LDGSFSSEGPCRNGGAKTTSLWHFVFFSSCGAEYYLFNGDSLAFARVCVCVCGIVFQSFVIDRATVALDVGRSRVWVGMLYRFVSFRLATRVWWLVLLVLHAIETVVSFYGVVLPMRLPTESIFYFILFRFVSSRTMYFWSCVRCEASKQNQVQKSNLRVRTRTMRIISWCRGV
jgi:hypothetical protein